MAGAPSSQSPTWAAGDAKPMPAQSRGPGTGTAPRKLSRSRSCQHSSTLSQVLSRPSDGTSCAPGFTCGSASSQSPTCVPAPPSPGSSQSPSPVGSGRPFGAHPSPSTSLRQASAPSQSLSTPSAGSSGAPWYAVASPSLQSPNRLDSPGPSQVALRPNACAVPPWPSPSASCQQANRPSQSSSTPLAGRSTPLAGETSGRVSSQSPPSEERPGSAQVRSVWPMAAPKPSRSPSTKQSNRPSQSSSERLPGTSVPPGREVASASLQSAGPSSVKPSAEQSTERMSSATGPGAPSRSASTQHRSRPSQS